MANANRKAIEFMVQGALPPNSTNVLWMDTSNPTMPVIKTFNAGAWVTVHTESGKIDEMLCQTIVALTDEVCTLSDEIRDKMAREATLLAVTKPATDEEIYAMFSGVVDEDGYICLNDTTIDSDGYLIADYTIDDNNLIIFN